MVRTSNDIRAFILCEEVLVRVLSNINVSVNITARLREPVILGEIFYKAYPLRILGALISQLWDTSPFTLVGVSFLFATNLTY